ncbi:hypothetical protein [Xanthomonas fragariae]|uniref:hypothetical protein n=1 Tax=Xanthomonas fragariae TaxID=48664 RepID=UPI00131F3846|nr:hypothetical protein [Xanthomonas fragariae]
MSPAQALNLLEMVLGWNNARMVFNGGRYNIVPADQANQQGHGKQARGHAFTHWV